MSFTFFSCKKDIERDIKTSETKNETKGTDPLNIDEAIILGAQLENPYSVENMQVAYNNLLKGGKQIPSALNVYTSHYYVRFLPADENELDILLQDTTLVLYDYPLDYEIASSGIYYHDPSISRDDITWQYCTVEANYSFPKIQYEILSSLFIPEEIPTYHSIQYEDVVYDLVSEALNITDNSDDIVSSRWSKWTPSGTIQVYDDIEDGMIPLIGVKVRARRWFITKSGNTDGSGNFTTGKFRRPVNYSIIWKTGQYIIRNGVAFQAYYNGPKKRSAWNLNISNGSNKSLRIATIHRAAYRYFYRNIDGLKRPEVWTKLRISYLNTGGYGINWATNWQHMIGAGGVIPNIHIHGKDPDDYSFHPTNVLFSTTIHEIGHSSHVTLMNGAELQFWQVSSQIQESWANALEWYITRLEYVDLGHVDYDDPNAFSNIDNMQNWNSSSTLQDYTPLFIDCIDSYNQALNRGGMPNNRCPDGGWFDGVNCRIGTPPAGETAFIYADKFYYTPVGCCDCPEDGSWFDGVNCVLLDIPDNSIGFVWNNIWYLNPAGNPNFPYDQISGYSISYLESNIIKYSYGLTSLRTKLKAHKPSNMTDKHIDVYLNFFFNL